MAIINNNVQNVKFLRNQDVNITRDTAIARLNEHKADAADGTALLARYTVSGEVKTIVGFVYVTGSTHDITIFDTEGASADVEELRREINAKLGEGVTSANTVTSQLEALSGATFTAGTSSSADTSVEGAKAYAYDLVGTLDGSVSAETGYYVKSVSEVDGKINGTTEALPTVADEASAKTFVTSVSENLGEISVSKGTITSSGKTIVLTDNADGGVNFEANVDGTTIIQDAETKKLKVADTALVQYVGDEDTIHISAVDAQNNKTVNSLLTISATTPTETNVKEQYNLVGASGNTIGATIKIYKDSSLYRAYLGHVDDTITSATDPTVVPGTGDTALCFIYLKTDGTYELVAVNVEEFIEENEFASGVTWDNIAKKVKGVVDTASEKDSQNTPVDFLTVGADGFKISGIKDEINRKLNAVVENLDATVTDATSGNHVTITIEEVDGKLVQSGLTIEENDIASASDLAELSGKTITAITSTNGSITASISNEAGNKTADIQTYADKIQMSGFTSDNSKVFSGIAESDSIATAFEKADTVVTRIRTDLNSVSGDVDTIKKQYISSVSVNGKAVAVANKVAPISITASTSATTAETSNAIVVNTDDNGNITLGLNYIDCGTY